MSFTPDEICEEVKKIIPEFEMTYEVDPVRQKIGKAFFFSLANSKGWGLWMGHVY